MAKDIHCRYDSYVQCYVTLPVIVGGTCCSNAHFHDLTVEKEWFSIRLTDSDCGRAHSSLLLKLKQLTKSEMENPEYKSLQTMASTNLTELKGLCSEEDPKFALLMKLNHDKDLITTLIIRKFFSSSSAFQRYYQCTKQLVSDACDVVLLDAQPCNHVGIHYLLQQVRQTTPSTAAAIDYISENLTKTLSITSEANRLYEDNMRLISRWICKECYERRSTNVILPCGHLALCDSCAETAAGQHVCPSCRRNANRIVRVYYS